MAGGAQALSRSLDKVLEDAQLTGVLSLPNRNLKQFPPSASKFDLSDTVTADLARNRLTELPVQICDYGSLECLFVYHNCIRFVPDAVQFLQSLTYLDLSRNQLESIPSVLCELPLEVLLLGQNRLENLPKQICGLSKTLMELDISCNHITCLPREMGDLRKLRVLNARRNLLKELPFECLCRMKLQFLDVSSNLLTELPLELRQITSLIELKVEKNPLISPPAKECNRGCVHTFKWLEMEAMRQNKRAKGLPDVEWPHMRSNSLSRKGKMVQSMQTEDMRGVLPRSKVDRRQRSSRYNTIGADSGYASTADENRWSQDLSLNGECTRRSPVGEEAPPPPPTCARPPVPPQPPRKVSAPSTITDSTAMTKSSPAPLLANLLNGTALNSAGLKSPERKKNAANSNKDAGSFVEEVMTACMQISEADAEGLARKTRDNSSSADEGSPTPKATPNKPENFPKQFQYGSGNMVNGGRFVRQTSETSSARVNGLENGHLTPIKQSPRNSTESETALAKQATPPRSMKSEDIQNIYTRGISPAKKVLDTAQVATVPNGVVTTKLVNGVKNEKNNADVITERNGNCVVDATETVGKEKKTEGGDGGFKKPLPPPPAPPGNHMKRSISGATQLPQKTGKSAVPSTSRKGSLSSSQSSLSSSTSGSANTKQKQTAAGVSRSGSGSSSSAAKQRPVKPPPAPPPTFKSTEKFTKPRDSLATAHSVALKKTMDPKTQLELVENMKRVLEERLGIELPTDYCELASTLSDGVHLCNLVNKLRTRAIATVHSTSETMSQLCTQADILEKKNVASVAKSVAALAKSSGSKPATTSKLPPKTAGNNNIQTAVKPSPKISNV